MSKHGIKQTLGEEIANAISHGVMALFGVAVLITLIIESGSNPYKLGGSNYLWSSDYLDVCI